MVGIFTVWAGQHGDGIATEILVEAASGTATAHGLVCGHRVVFAVEVGVELRRLLGGGGLKLVEEACHDGGVPSAKNSTSEVTVAFTAAEEGQRMKKCDGSMSKVIDRQ